MTGLISHPFPRPKCDERYRVKPEDYFFPLRHAVRMELIEQSEIKSVVRKMIPGCEDWTDAEIQRRIEWMG